MAPPAQTVAVAQPTAVAQPMAVATIVALVNVGRLGEAEQAARTRLQGEPDDGVLWKILGVALLRQGKDSLPALRRATQLLPDDAEAHSNLGAALSARRLWEEALASLWRALEIQPRNLQALVDTANTLCAVGRPGEAVPLYQRALEVDPGLAEVHNNLGNAFQELRQCAQAVACYRQALAGRPDDAEIHCNLGNALRQLGELDEAIDSSRRALALEPRLVMAHNNLGLALAAHGRPAEAAASFRQALALNGRFVEAMNNLGNVLRDQGEQREALSLYRQALALDPQRADSHCYLGSALFDSGEVGESIASFQRALALKPDHPRARVGLASALRLAGRIEEAQASCRAALAADPRHVEAIALLGDLRADCGDLAQAQQLFEQAIAIDPHSPAVLCSIAAHRKMTGADADWVSRVEALLDRRLSLEHEIGLRFALGKYHDDLGQFAQAFDHYRRANELSKRHAPRFERSRLTQQVDRTLRTFDRAFVRAPHAGASAVRVPVLIIGMPRSGTSLAEQILASHPQVFGAGEVRFWDSAFAAFEQALGEGRSGEDTFADSAREYLARLTAAAPGGAAHVIDKMPANFLYAGLIHAVFPHARILHMRRDPLDTCLSIYFQNFVDMRSFASDLEDLAHYYREYLRILEHWRAVLPCETLLEVPYEALVSDQEGWTRRMLKFIGLPWDARCLDFHRTERAVITASRAQVRRKISAASVGRWRNYADHLAALRPLADARPDHAQG